MVLCCLCKKIATPRVFKVRKIDNLMLFQNQLNFGSHIFVYISELAFITSKDHLNYKHFTVIFHKLLSKYSKLSNKQFKVPQNAVIFNVI